jgi:glucosamine-6-phosphate deaminase
MTLVNASRPIPQRTFQVDRLHVEIYADRQETGLAAAMDVATLMRAMMVTKHQLTMVFAAAPSQNELLAALRVLPDLDWPRVAAFHLDEYVGLPPEAPQRFGNFLRQALFERIFLGQVHYLEGSAPDPEQERERYAMLLAHHPPDIICLGVGENGHIAFNDPQDTAFADAQSVKLVTLNVRSRLQQVHDGCFPSLDEVPRQALTLTVPAIMAGRSLRCVVPGATKANAVREMLEGQVGPRCPASALRQHSDCVLYLDAAAAAALR